MIHFVTQIYKVSRALTLVLCCILCTMFFISCAKGPHEGERGLTVELNNSQCSDVPIGNITLCLYGMDGNLAFTYNCADAQSIAAVLFPLPAGHYTVGIVVNATPENRFVNTLTALHEWVETEAAGNCILLSGTAEVNVAVEGISRAIVPLYQSVFPLPVLRLRLTLPDSYLPDYISTETKTRAAVAGYSLRCVAELCKRGTDNVVFHKSVTPALQADGTYLVELAATEGDYDLRLWTDYVRAATPLADTYYHTETLKAVTIMTEPYAANTDTKDAACYNGSVTLPEEGTEISVCLQRPLAKYRIIADDVEKYRMLTGINPQKYPPIEELTVTVQYDGYYPSEFNVVNGKVTDAITGIAYVTSLVEVPLEATEVTMTSDWILTGISSENVAVVTITVADRAGRIVCQVGGIVFAYRQGQLTTLRGQFLTAGVSGGGISVDTDWEDIIIRF